MKKKIIIFFLIFFSFSKIVFSQELKITDVVINGNKNITNETILNSSGIKSKNFVTDIDKLNFIKKKLFETNFFSKIEVKTSNNTLIINVSENPLVEFIVISGLEERKDFKQEIEKILSLKPNYIFSEFFLNSDIVLIRDYLKTQGYFDNKIDYKVNIIENNRANVFFDIKLNKKFFIKNINFIGDKKFPAAKLLSIISSTEDSFLNFLSSSSIPSIERLNFDLISLKNFYLSEGYYDVQISNASINIVNDDQVDVVFSINAGNKYIVSDYLIDNDISFLNKNDVIQINSLIKKYINENYNQYKLNKLRNLIFDYINKKGFNTNVYYSIKKKSDKELIYVLRINEILEKRIIRNIKVVGNDITEEKVVRNNILFSEGDVFKELLLKQSEDKLKSLYLFKDINIKSNNFDKLDFVDVIISLKESPTGEISSGIGIGTSGSTIAFNLKENNFLGQGIKTDIGLSLGTQRILGNLFFSNPDFLDTGNTFSNNFFITKNNYDSAGYENKIIGNTTSYAYQIFQDIEFQVGIGANFDSVKVDSDASPLIKTQDGNYFTSKVFYNFFNDKRDRKFQPTSGYTLAFGQEFAFAPSDIPYISNNFYGSFFKELLDDFTGTIKYKIKSINSLNDDSLKLSDRLFLSSSELRGFSLRGIGPKVANDFIGGNYSFATSASTTFPNGLPDSWKASSNLFFDLANVWGSDISGVDDSNKLRSSIGAGFTWGSPIGPISMTYAIPLLKAESDDVENFNIRLGGVF